MKNVTDSFPDEVDVLGLLQCTRGNTSLTQQRARNSGLRGTGCDDISMACKVLTEDRLVMGRLHVSLRDKYQGECFVEERRLRISFYPLGHPLVD